MSGIIGSQRPHAVQIATPSLATLMMMMPKMNSTPITTSPMITFEFITIINHLNY
jgi:hypothetical protein